MLFGVMRDPNDDAIYEVNSKRKKMTEKSSGSGRVDILFYFADDVAWANLTVSNTIAEMNAALDRSEINNNLYVKQRKLKLIK